MKHVRPYLKSATCALISCLWLSSVQAQSNPPVRLELQVSNAYAPDTYLTAVAEDNPGAIISSATLDENDTVIPPTAKSKLKLDAGSEYVEEQILTWDHGCPVKRELE